MHMPCREYLLDMRLEGQLIPLHFGMQGWQLCHETHHALSAMARFKRCTLTVDMLAGSMCPSLYLSDEAVLRPTQSVR